MSLLNWGNRSLSGANEELSPLAAQNLVNRNFSLLGHCANSECRSVWFHLFRHHARPIFEAGWTCSPQCTEACLQSAVRRELSVPVNVQVTHRHRIPLGLLMHEKGWITSSQLRCAVEAQKEHGSPRIGEWLVRQGAADESLVTRALSVQWSCPVVPLSNGTTAVSSFLPQLFIDVFGVLPVQWAPGRTVYLGFEQNVDRALALALQRIEGSPVECGIVQSSTFRETQRRLQTSGLAGTQIAEAATGSAAAHLFSKAIERARPIRSRLVRVHEWLWLRMFLKPQPAGERRGACVRDVVCRVGFLDHSSDDSIGR